jgi:hypothetical protein
VVEDIVHLAPLGKINLQLTADNTPPPPPPVESIKIHKNEDGSWITTTTVGSSYSYPSILNNGCKETDNTVIMSVGKDNRLWIKVGDTWRRVALDG